MQWQYAYEEHCPLTTKNQLTTSRQKSSWQGSLIREKMLVYFIAEKSCTTKLLKMFEMKIRSLCFQPPDRRDWLTGRETARNFDLNRSFPDLNRVMYRYEQNGGPTHHLPIPTYFYERHKPVITVHVDKFDYGNMGK